MAEHAPIKIGRRQFELSRPDKLLFPADGVTKADLVDYDRRVASVMVPHLRGRPLMLERFPDGIGKSGFYQKNVPEYFPAWIHHATIPKAGGTVTHVVCDDEATLAYLAAEGCITPHTWLSRVDRLERPDRIIFDLDPSGPDFATVRQTARALADLLDAIGLVPFVQTTGSRGLHVVAPIDRRTNFDDVRAFAHDVADIVAAADATHRTVEQRKAKRRGRVFIDILRNAYAQTAVAPYSVRPLAGGPVATPLAWRELGDGRLTAQRYTIHNLPRRLAHRGDPWADLPRSARSLSAAIDALARLTRHDIGRTG
jgi:bifunctional non-homologous end joining protein LigD